MTLELLGCIGIKTTAIIIEIANIGLLSGLLYLYTKSYRQIKIGFTIGLMLFALTLLIRSIATIAFLIIDNDALIGKPIYIGGIIEVIALTILLKISNT
ncbi:MAG: hypothetical protein HZC47_08800 [Methanobacterium sp.]|uniref:hypothetical protein n=1 Tax=Methanobacterium sp. TaxID=2164 RepID=UPI003D64982A|nr:hypothetical protein [Methanobacterium sp.]